jgi:MFS transporter, PHS family, inorganic phosphate transporter
MMASVFIMQPLGQVAAAVVGLAVLLTIGSGLSSVADSEAAAVTVDRIWRVVVGVGAFPAFVAIYFRLTIPESPRWTLNVDHDGTRALQDTEKYLKLQQALHRNSRQVEVAENGDIEGGVVAADSEPLQEPEQAALAGNVGADGAGDDAASSDIQSIHDEDGSDGEEGDDDERPPDPFSWPELKSFFYTEGNIKYLLGTSMTWFLLDFAFYGLGINNPRVLAEIWAYNPIRTDAPATPSWGNPSDPDLYDPGQLGKSIYGTLYWDGVRSIITTCIGSLIGSLIIIKLINYVPRKAWLTWSFISMTVLFAIAGGSFFAVAYTHLHALIITFYVLAQLLFNLGPNTLTFIIPAEIFPTRYRGTCHGISAAAGKLGSIIVQAFLQRVHVSDANSHSLAWVLIGFSFAMGLGAVFAWAWLPEVQHARGWVPDDGAQGGVGAGVGTTRRRGLSRYVVESKSLEELAVRQRRNVEPVDEGMQVGFRLRGRRLAARVGGVVQRRRRGAG